MGDNTDDKSKPGSGSDVTPAVVKIPCLIVIKGDFIGRVYELGSGITLIGSSDEVDVVISDLSISRRHAMLVGGIEGFHVSDLGSGNGTLVNGSSIAERRKLAEGDKIRLGDVTFKFSYQDEEDKEYHHQLRNMAIKDGLTQIYNVRYFLEVMEKEFEYNKRMRTGLSLVLFDIDHFKAINDTYGHTAGDYVLKTLAQRIENAARGYDVFARYGGEEFVFLLRGANLDAALVLAERVRTIVEAYRFEFEGNQLEITVSLGAGYWDGGQSMESPRDLIAMVDRHLYEAKNAGRNTVRF